MEFKKTGDDDFPTHIKALVTGQPKTGKTTVASTFPNVIVAAVEDGLQSIAHKDIAYVDIDSRNTLLQLATMLEDDGLRARIAENLGMEKVESVAIDTLDALQELMKAERMKSERRQHMERDDWGWLLEEMLVIVRKFVSLPLHVVFTVHAKTMQDEDGRLVIRPMLQGAIQDKIAGEVGYSLLSQRETEIEQTSGKKRAVYSLLTEGDEVTYPDLGNRAAGRLDRVIEPDFQHLHDAVYEGLEIAKSQRTDVEGDGSDERPEVEVEQTETEPEPQTATQANKAGDEEKITPAAIGHLNKMLKQFGVELSPGVTHGDTWTMKEAREVGKFVIDAKKGHSEGKIDDLESMVIEGLIAMGAVTPVVGEPSVAVPTGTVDEIVEWANTDARRQSALAHELGKKDDGRSTLVDRLKRSSNTDLDEDVDTEDVAEAAQVPDDAEPPSLSVVDDEEAEDEPEAQEEAPEPEPEPDDEDETPEPPSLEDASKLIEEELGGEVVTESEDERMTKPCEECGKTAKDNPDEFDLDVADLGLARYRRWLCITDYMKEKASA